MTCEECGHVHERCAAHKKRIRPKVPCNAWPRTGSTVCHVHGGEAGQVKRKGEARAAVQEARQFLSQEPVVPIGDPVASLLALTAEATALYAHLRDKVSELETQRWSVPIGEDGRAAIDVLVAAMERALDRAGKFLEVVCKLNLEERLVQISERQADLLRQVLTGALADPELGLDEDTQRRALPVVARHIHMVQAS